MSDFKPGDRVTGVRHPDFGDGQVTGEFIFWDDSMGETHGRVALVADESVEGSRYYAIAIRPCPEKEPPVSTRERVLDEAKVLVTGDRNRSYGSPTQNFRNTAELWTTQFRHKLKDGESFSPADVARAMAQLKLARMIAGDKEDNWTDLIGYAACGAECDEEVTDG